MDVNTVHNYFRVPELDGCTRVAGCAQVTNFAEVAKSWEGSPKGARTET